MDPLLDKPGSVMRKGKKLKLMECVIVVVLATIIVGLIVLDRCFWQDEPTARAMPQRPRRTRPIRRRRQPAPTAVKQQTSVQTSADGIATSPKAGNASH